MTKIQHLTDFDVTFSQKNIKKLNCVEVTILRLTTQLLHLNVFYDLSTPLFQNIIILWMFLRMEGGCQSETIFDRMLP